MRMILYTWEKGGKCSIVKSHPVESEQVAHSLYLRVDRLRHANPGSIDAIDPERVLEGEILEDDGIIAHAAQAETMVKKQGSTAIIRNAPPCASGSNGSVSGLAHIHSTVAKD